MNEQIADRTIVETIPCVVVSERHYDSLLASVKKHRKFNIILILGGMGFLIYTMCKKNNKLRERVENLKDENDRLKIMENIQ